MVKVFYFSFGGCFFVRNRPHAAYSSALPVFTGTDHPIIDSGRNLSLLNLTYDGIRREVEIEIQGDEKVEKGGQKRSCLDGIQFVLVQ